MESPSYNLFSKQPANDKSLDPNARIKKINLSKRGGTHLPPAQADSSFQNLMNNNEELTTSRLVGDLISLRSSLPSSGGMSSYSTDQADYSSNATSTTGPNMNFDMEVIDRLFYKYPANRKTDN